MEYNLPEEYEYSFTGTDGRELHFVCTNEALPEMVRGFTASENAPEPGFQPVKTIYSMSYLNACMHTACEHAVKYHETGGMHFAALFDESGLLSYYEDISRHNSADKVIGDCLLRNLNTQDCALIVSGRISSEMVKKAGLLGVSVIASQAKSMLNAYQLAERANITLVGYLGKGKTRIYCAPERILADES